MEKHTYVVRVVRDAAGRLAGHISDPTEGWRRPFSTAQELWRLVSQGPVAQGAKPSDKPGPSQVAEVSEDQPS